MLRQGAFACFILALLAYCAVSQAQKSAPPKSLAYVLQGESMGRTRTAAAQKLAKSGRDWIVIDASHTGTAQGKWTRRHIAQIRAGKPGRRVLAYLSIGEAEDYRPYWKPAWDANRNGKPDKAAPLFLENENPDWKGNYKVRYWQEDWQKIILRSLDEIVAQGFDGVYLDIIDGFEYFEIDPTTQRYVENRVNPETQRTFRADMITWVQRIAAHARKTKTDFTVIPQNGVQLLEAGDYREIIDGIGVEDLFNNGNKFQSKQHLEYQLAFLAKLKPLAKPIFVIEYATKSDTRKRSIALAKKNKFLLLLTDRPLKTLGMSIGY